jgi:catechol-2,3-dioxygenase
MLGQQNAIATLAVKDMHAAKKFYEGALGLEPLRQLGDEVVTYKAGNSVLNVYRSSYAGTNRATAVTWTLGNDFDSTVQNLQQKGVKFEHYDLPQMTLKGDVHCAQGSEMKAAWFKDPDGNIVGLVNN